MRLPTILFLSVAALGAVPGPAAAFTYTPYSAGNTPLSVTVADFNGDGYPDIAVDDQNDNDVSIYLNNGDGTFAPRVNYDVGHAGAGLITADFNNDGVPDLAIAGYNANVVTFLLGDGHGGFHKPLDIDAASGPAALAVGDFNHDGNIDLAVANAVGSVSVLLGKGNGRFARGHDYATGSGSSSVVAGDFTGSGKLDLAVANLGAKTISLLRGTGDGAFGKKQDFKLGKFNNPWQVVAGDFNGDGRPDLAVATSPCDCIDVLLNSGDRNVFAKPKRYQTSVSQTRSLVAVDINGDGKLDIAAAGFNGDAVSLLFGNGKGGFGKLTTIETGNAPVSIAAGDFNGDGAMDLTTADWDDYEMGVLLQ